MADVREQLLEALWERRGSDLMLTPGCAPLLRVDGELRRLDGWSEMTSDQTAAILAGMLTKQQNLDFETSREIDFSFGWHDRARFRVNGFVQRGSVAIALRRSPAGADRTTFSVLPVRPVTSGPA